MARCYNPEGIQGSSDLNLRLGWSSHHAEGLVDPKVLAKKTDFGYPRADIGKIILKVI
jgi:hypothetical protein